MTTPGVKLTSQQVGNAGQQYVAAEIHRRGGYAVTFAGNMKGIDMLASDAKVDRIIKIQVKTKTRGDWQTTITEGKQRTKPSNETKYWVFADIGKEHPEFYVVPGWWIENNIYENHQAYLKKNKGTRAKNPDSKHHSIRAARIEQWKDAWSVLGIF